ncbi:PQQ-dependent sugar dehydrogenase [Pontibacter akesuensis]|uniref:Glucose/arabinose dehydrogenase, beta-propeller fold n=1 Tax=Pontibacter akesuensis TaxID=388950 RepID=A0A1I7HUF1_9BACT|nr:sorbosone dehydrogenase family protein [Pontibacter akesuensis]GHA63581.1 sorbosone dehydrogenase [Pontibacter akesuensis]SFU64251.1 Glucose/arabinose dehydrogenase, beta-propeller fold [Pontibacter akesuensis]
MKKNLLYILSLSTALVAVSACNSQPPVVQGQPKTIETPAGQTVTLPPPHATESHRNFSNVIGWKDGQTPTAPEGFTVTKYADGFQNPRWLYVMPNGDVLVAEASTEVGFWKELGAKIIGITKSMALGNSANRITLLRDTDKDGRPEVRETFLDGLNQPLGMLVLDGKFYVANTDGLWRYPYQNGQTKISAKGEKLLDLPAGGYNNHWTRNIIARPDGSKIYVAVGSASDHGEHGMEHEERRANILEVNPNGTGARVFASGLRNPVGMDWAPNTNTLWTAVNERDDLGDELVPDYLTSVQEGGFYGWPYFYFGQNEDPSWANKMPAKVQQPLVPDVPLVSHSASLGLAFYDQEAFPQKYHNGAFIGQHGSWRRSELVGYRIVFVPFENGKPSGPPEDFLTGFFADKADGKVYGRPVGITVLPDGSMLVADDTSNTIWRVSAK